MARQRINPTALMAAVGLCASVGGAQGPLPAVRVAQAQIRQAHPTFTLVATVGPVRRSLVSAEIAGLVVDYPVRQGDQVHKGDMLCKLDDRILKLRLAEAAAEFGAASAFHEELLHGTRPEEIRRYRALLDEAETEVERWQFEMERIERLYEGSASNAKEYSDTRTALQAAKRRQAAAQADYDLAVAGPRSERIAAAAFEAARLQAIVDQIEYDIARCRVQAPFSGYVVERHLEVGQWVVAGGPVAEMIDLSTVLARVDVPESAFPFVQPGVQARIFFDALGSSFGGVVKHVIRQADVRARTFPVEVELDNREGRFAAGMFARVTLPAGPRESVVAVPKDAVVEKERTSYAGVLTFDSEGGQTQAMLVPVGVGADIEDWIAVRSGRITAGTYVVIRGNESLQPFPVPVRVVDEHGNAMVISPSAPPSRGKGGT